MKKKYGKDNSFTMQEWCQLNYMIYQDLFLEEGKDATIEDLIENYYCCRGVILDKDFVFDMLDCLPSSCTHRVGDRWTLSLSSVSCFSQN